MNRFLPLAILILMTAACSRHEARVAAGSEPRVAALQVETVAASEVADIYRASGTVRAHYSAAIAAKIAANILEVPVQTGDRVQAGQRLIILDRRDLEANVRRSEAASAEDESAISETENAIAAARANLELARVTHERFQGLLAKANCEAVLVPHSAVLERGQIRSVCVVEGDTARLRFVTLGKSRDDQREILSGLTAGEKIIVSPPRLLADGGRVAIQEAAK